MHLFVKGAYRSNPQPWGKPLQKAEGEFRGGDPEELQMKKEEKREEMIATGEDEDLDKAFADFISKAEGEFRGGDPEELEFKKQEKEREMKESGALEEQEEEAAEEEELADPGAQEEAEFEEAERKEEAEAEKSLLSYPNIGNQVSPVGTGDYVPKDAQGEPFDPLTYRGNTQPWVQVGPTRAGENQFKRWSEVLGLPQRMAPAGPPEGWQEVREESLRERDKMPRPGPLPRGEVPVSKAFGEEQEEDPTQDHTFEAPPEEEPQAPEEQQAAPEDEEEMGFDMDVEPIEDAEEARRILMQVPNMERPMLMYVAKKIWGPEFEYDDEWADDEYVKDHVIGSLLDIIESEEGEHPAEAAGIAATPEDAEEDVEAEEAPVEDEEPEEDVEPLS